MGSRQRAKGDVPEPFQPPTSLRAACQDLCLAPSWGTWGFLSLGPNRGETNIDTSQCSGEGVCCLCAALLAPTQLLAGSWDGCHPEEGEVPISPELDNVPVVLLGWIQPCSW